MSALTRPVTRVARSLTESTSAPNCRRWDAIAVAISRTARGEEEAGAAWHPEQCISNEVAWKSSTSNGKIGIEVGGQADLVVLADDPLEANAKRLRAMEVRGTMLGGRWTHCRL